jgi:hypothetical protein
MLPVTLCPSGSFDFARISQIGNRIQRRSAQDDKFEETYYGMSKLMP